MVRTAFPRLPLSLLFAGLMAGAMSTAADAERRSDRANTPRMDAAERDTMVARDARVSRDAPAGPSLYGAIQAGYADAKAIAQTGPDDLNGVMIGALLGYDFGRVRVEADYAYRGLSFPTDGVPDSLFGPPRPSDAIDVHTLIANVAVDQPLTDRVEAYALGGAGVAFVNDLGPAEQAFTWQAGGGLVFKPRAHLALDLGYRFQRTETLGVGSRIETHNGVVAVRLYF
ncbi:opacity protein-like surface antigen [Rhodothalassium salexigens DSM 2132]|uniref:Opacity protein-like surface antigen n=1 Tax=Rhodothalassium salexigens DSM 2132 TaxID=1188247 RepID=A0A4R2PR52_RHOSA|nr:outer membrane beta-barrel protein [Rhodothalassium salexigens]MBB4210169.1 opacity protein-like surface antigen [Rhodothalassium salexigens DSM 2132]MBK1639304.1 hypothetical protein [Rhodothalassium salexigens DSM 2132]TCP38333.1 opacity protein-like surface antigen [Rhodothalassium salexigens DSM 2132]